MYKCEVSIPLFWFAGSPRILAKPWPVLERHCAPNAAVLQPGWLPDCWPPWWSLGRPRMHVLHRDQLRRRQPNQEPLCEDQQMAGNESVKKGGLELGDVQQLVLLQQCSRCWEGWWHWSSLLPSVVSSPEIPYKHCDFHIASPEISRTYIYFSYKQNDRHRRGGKVMKSCSFKWVKCSFWYFRGQLHTAIITRGKMQLRSIYYYLLL